MIWNGVARRRGSTTAGSSCAAEGRAPAAAREDRPTGRAGSRTLPSTPFAVVVGTISADPAMRAMCEWKVKGFVDVLAGLAEGRARASSRTRRSRDADAARYSLLLVGGPADNAVAKRLADRIPLEVRQDAVVVDGKAFAATDAGVALVYPSPLNPGALRRRRRRHLAGGLWFADGRTRELGLLIVDGRSGRRGGPRPAGPASRSGGGSCPATSTALAPRRRSSGARRRGAAREGDAHGRAPARGGRPAAALDRVTGTYEIPGGPAGPGLPGGEPPHAERGTGQGGGGPRPGVGDGVLRLGESIRLVFEKDAAGKATGDGREGPGPGDPREPGRVSSRLE